MSEEQTPLLPLQVSEKIVALLQEKRAFDLEAKRQSSILHKKLWDTIHIEYPKINKDANFKLIAKHIDIGVVILEAIEDSRLNSTSEALDKLLANFT